MINREVLIDIHNAFSLLKRMKTQCELIVDNLFGES